GPHDEKRQPGDRQLRDVATHVASSHIGSGIARLGRMHAARTGCASRLPTGAPGYVPIEDETACRNVTVSSVARLTAQRVGPHRRDTMTATDHVAAGNDVDVPPADVTEDGELRRYLMA